MKYYVYKITNLINGKMYIGKRSCSCDIEDDNYMGSGKILKQAIEKYGIENFSKDIIETFDNEDDAYKFEREYILKCDAVNNNKYYNLAEGGLGGNTWGKRENHPMYNRTHSEESRKKISEARKELYKRTTHPCVGKKLSEETKKKISEARIKNGAGIGGKNPSARKVVCIETGETFECIKYAAEHYNINPSRIQSCVLGTSKSTILPNNERVRWCYYEDYITNNYKKEYVDNRFRGKRVICITTGEIFDKMSDAAEKYNISNGDISTVCKGKAKSAGKLPGTKIRLQWKYL